MRPYRRRRPGGSIRPHLSILFLLLGVLIPLLLREPAPPAPAPLPQGEVLESVRAALPEELEPLRRAFVESGAALAGRVGYFWGGKSDAVGWDARWGVPAVVISPGSDTTGESIPFGLDCSGFVSWCAVNAAGDARRGGDRQRRAGSVGPVHPRGVGRGPAGGSAGFPRSLPCRHRGGQGYRREADGPTLLPQPGRRGVLPRRPGCGLCRRGPPDDLYKHRSRRQKGAQRKTAARQQFAEWNRQSCS